MFDVGTMTMNVTNMVNTIKAFMKFRLADEDNVASLPPMLHGSAEVRGRKH
jgi:hypothetical protein